MSRLSTYTGSSPLTRGKPVSLLRARERRGLIPAHAGKTTPSRWPPPPAWAHPRSRGENAINLMPHPTVPGSSPLTRGKLKQAAAVFQTERLIPAHAGKTLTIESAPEITPAHPRSRGENPSVHEARFHRAGSSPLTRGKQARYGLLARQRGLIPAHAGKTDERTAREFSQRAHPRSRGENGYRLGHNVTYLGSSPLTRGKLSAVLSREQVAGLIPAHAGKTQLGNMLVLTFRAHPRSRGENDLTTYSPPLICGSSPLTRGKRR